MGLIKFDDIDPSVFAVDGKDTLETISLESKVEQDLVVEQLTESARDLVTIHDRIITRQGVCRQDILELSQHADSYANIYKLLQNHSPFLFTEEPSSIGLSEISESLEKSVVDIVKNSIQWLLSAIWKVLTTLWKWAKAVGSFLFSVDKDNSNKIKPLTNFVQNVESAVNNAQQPNPSNVQPSSSSNAPVDTRGLVGKFERDMKRVKDVEAHNLLKRWNSLNNELMVNPAKWNPLYGILGDILSIDLNRFANDCKNAILDYNKGVPASQAFSRINTFTITPALVAWLNVNTIKVTAVSTYSPPCLVLDIANDLKTHVATLSNRRYTANDINGSNFLEFASRYELNEQLYELVRDILKTSNGATSRDLSDLNLLTASVGENDGSGNANELFNHLTHAAKVAEAFNQFHHVLVLLHTAHIRVTDSLGTGLSNMAKSVHKFCKDNTKHFDMATVQRITKEIEDLNTSLREVRQKL